MLAYLQSKCIGVKNRDWIHRTFLKKHLRMSDWNFVQEALWNHAMMTVLPFASTVLGERMYLLAWRMNTNCVENDEMQLNVAIIDVTSFCSLYVWSNLSNEFYICQQSLQRCVSDKSWSSHLCIDLFLIWFYLKGLLVPNTTFAVEDVSTMAILTENYTPHMSYCVSLILFHR